MIIKDIQVTRKNVSEVVPLEPTAPTDFASATQVQTQLSQSKKTQVLIYCHNLKRPS